MIKFFRKIRQSLLTENKFSKYLLYAIGEILLVVIGILIALQINNWNEGQKLKIEEINTLKVLRDGIAQDTVNIKRQANWLSFAENRIIRAKSELEKENPSDSLGSFVSVALMNFDFKLNRAPYEALKANNPNIISNDSLRNAIISFYEYRHQFIENYSDQVTIPNRSLLTHSIDLFENISRYDSITESTWHARKLVPYDIASLKKDKRFLTLLNTKLTNIRYEYHFSFPVGLKNLTEMLEVLDREIKKLEDE